MHTDWGVAAATIIGAIIGAVGLWIVEYLRKERQLVKFIVNGPVDLAHALRAHGSFQIKVGEEVTEELIAANIDVQNAGNRSVKPFYFTLMIPGKHRVALVQPSTENEGLRSVIKVSPDGNVEEGSVFKIELPFFNRGERFKVTAIYDGPSAECRVHCHLQDVASPVLCEAQGGEEPNHLKSFGWGIVAGFLATSMIVMVWILISTK
jgi:hypothetical protein